jgi:hypothetical protein
MTIKLPPGEEDKYCLSFYFIDADGNYRIPVKMKDNITKKLSFRLSETRNNTKKETTFEEDPAEVHYLALDSYKPFYVRCVRFDPVTSKLKDNNKNLVKKDGSAMVKTVVLFTPVRPAR